MNTRLGQFLGNAKKRVDSWRNGHSGHPSQTDDAPTAVLSSELQENNNDVATDVELADTTQYASSLTEYSVTYPDARREDVIQQEMIVAIMAGNTSGLQDLITEASKENLWGSIERLSLLKLSIDSMQLPMAKAFIDSMNTKISLIRGLQSESIYLARLTMLAAADGDLDLTADCLFCRESLGKDKKFDLEPVLGQAAISGQESVVRYFLDKGASPDVEINGQSVLQLVRKHRNSKNESCIKLLTFKSESVIAEFFKSAQEGDEESVKMFLADGVEPNVVRDYMTPLGTAVLYNKEAIVKILLEKEANPDAEVYVLNNEEYILTTPYYIALQYEKSAYLTLMTPKSTAAADKMKEAMQQGNTQLVQFLLEHGFAALIEERSLLKFAVQCHHAALSNEENEEIVKGLEEIIKELLTKYQANPYVTTPPDNKSAWTVVLELKTTCVKLFTQESEQKLRSAVGSKNFDLAKKLLEEKVDPDAKLEGNQSALEIALAGGDQVYIKLITPYSRQAIDDLFAAAEDKDVTKAKERVKELLDNGVNPRDVMVEALNNDKPKCVDALLGCGFNPDTEIHEGKSALQIAREEKRTACVKILISKSNTAIGALNAALFSGETAKNQEDQLTKAEQLFEEGASSENINPESLKKLTKNRHKIDAKNHPNLAKIIHAARDEQTKKWQARESGIDHPLITDLGDEIAELEKAKGNAEARQKFITSLEILRNDLRKNMDKQRKKLNENSKSVKFAEYTLEMLRKLKIPKEKGVPPADYKNSRLQILREYEDKCKKTSRTSKFLKILGMICFAAVGFVVGAVIGMGIGIALGAWSGPGAFVTAALGMITGAVVGTTAMIGVAAGAGGAGLAAFGLSGGLLFKPRGLRKEAGEVAHCGKRFVQGG